MIIKKTTLKFEPSTSPDVVGYTLFVQEVPTEVDYDSEAVDLGPVTEVDLASLQLNTRDGVFNIGIAAYDDAGNFSSMVKLQSVALDFVAPDPPSNLTILREIPDVEPVDPPNETP